MVEGDRCVAQRPEPYLRKEGNVIKERRLSMPAIIRVFLISDKLAEVKMLLIRVSAVKETDGWVEC